MTSSTSTRPRAGKATCRIGARPLAAALIFVGTAMAAATACSTDSPAGAGNTPAAASSPAASSAASDDFSSAPSATGTVGKPFSFKIDTADPNARITASGTLPAGITFRWQIGEGATLAGEPDAGSGGLYHLVFSARGGSGQSVQHFTLAVDEGPTFVGAQSIVTWALKYNHTPILTKGYPAAKITESGTLPSGMVFRDDGGGTAEIDGNPRLIGATGASAVTVTAANAVGQTTETINVTAVNGSSLVNLIFHYLIP